MLDYLDGEGRELRTILLDDQRAPLVRQAFTLYATGEWTIARLTKHLNNQGLTTPPGPRTPSKPLIKGHVQRLLTNPLLHR